MKKCIFCGAENTERALFCELCGRRFLVEAVELNEEPIIADESETEYSADKSKAQADDVVPVLESESTQMTNKKTDNNSLMASNGDQGDAFSCHKQRSNSKGGFIVFFVIVAIAAIIFIITSTFNRLGDNNSGIDINDEIPAVAPIDVNESNDSPDSATIVQVGNTYKGVLSSASDKDYFRVEANGHSSLSYTFTRKSSRAVDGIGWEISHHTGNSKYSRMAWLNEETLTDECYDIVVSDGYFIVWIENERNDPNMEDVMKFVSHTEYSITFNYVD